MSYLLDRKNKKKKIEKIIVLIFLFFLIFLFRTPITKGLSSVFHFIARPIFIFSNNIERGFENFNHYFVNKKNLTLENEILEFKLKENEIKMANYNTILVENQKLKEIMGRKTNNDFILGVILSKPNRSFYDSLIIDIGQNDGLIIGKKVFAYGSMPIGFIGEVYENSSKVVLYSNPGEKTDVILSDKDIFIQMIGRGAGNFEIILPRDVTLEVGNEIVLPGVNPYPVAEVTKVISDPHDSYQKILLLSPVNIFELKFVEVEK